jgi:uncharacterized membrane protein YqgA involved in biofilm formation
MFKGIGTLIDVGVIVVAGLAGLIIGKKINKNLPETLIKVIGLICIVSGVQMALAAVNFLSLLVGVLIGVGMGESLRLEDKIEAKLPKTKGKNLTQALVTAALVSLVGPLAILGPIQEGINGDLRLMMLKTGFDSISSPILAASLGVGAVFSAIPVLLFQGALTLFGQALGRAVTDSIMNQLVGVGGVVVLALGLKILKIKDFKVVNMLPAFLTVLLISLIIK